MIRDLVRAMRRDERLIWALALVAFLQSAWLIAHQAAAAEIEAAHLRERGITTTATIVRTRMDSFVNPGSGLSYDFQVLTVGFVDQAGHHAEGCYPYFFGDRGPAQVGETERIVYDPADPSEVRRIDADYRDSKAILYGAMAATLLGLAGAVGNRALDRVPEKAWQRWQQSRRARRRARRESRRRAQTRP